MYYYILENKTDIDETKSISYIIKGLINENKCKYEDIAILYRLNLQCYPFDKMFFKKGIPYKIINEFAIYQTKIIKKIYYYLKFVTRPDLNYYLEKIINYPKKKINKDEKHHLFSLSKTKNISVWEIIKRSDDPRKMKKFKIGKRLQRKLRHFKNKILNIMSKLNHNSVYDIVYELIECLNLRRYLENDSSSLEKMNMLLDKISELKEKYTLNQFLEQMSLSIEDKDNDEKVKLMTIHQAKGLEFKYVFVVGVEEGFYPFFTYSKDIIEEERRILYVAITRAKEKCYISYSKERIIGAEKKKENQVYSLKKLKKN